MKELLKECYLGNEIISVRLQNNIRRTIRKNCTFKELLKYKELLLNKIVGMRTRKELIELIEIISQ